MDGSVLDFVLAGLEQALELERELGVRSVEVDKSLLAGSEKPKAVPPPIVKRTPPPPPVVKRQPLPPPPQPAKEPQSATVRDIVFLHHRPLSAAGAEMMEKIIKAMGRTPENTPIIVTQPAPKAKVTVILGGRAMKLYYPEMKGEPGQWFQSATEGSILVTYSPEYILRFDTVTPAVQKLKQEMWRSLKAVVQRLALTGHARP